MLTLTILLLYLLLELEAVDAASKRLYAVRVHINNRHSTGRRAAGHDDRRGGSDGASTSTDTDERQLQHQSEEQQRVDPLLIVREGLRWSQESNDEGGGGTGGNVDGDAAAVTTSSLSTISNAGSPPVGDINDMVNQLSSDELLSSGLLMLSLDPQAAARLSGYPSIRYIEPVGSMAGRDGKYHVGPAFPPEAVSGRANSDDGDDTSRSNPATVHSEQPLSHLRQYHNRRLGPRSLQQCPNAAVQSNPQNWALDRIDQRLPVLDSQHQSSSDPRLLGRNVDVYVIDSGVNANHQEFRTDCGAGQGGGASSRVQPGINFLLDQPEDDARDSCRGHGTAVASLAAGCTLGVARSATIVPVRTNNCSGDWFVSDVIKALDWILTRASGKPGNRGIVNLSGGANGISMALDDAVAAAVRAGLLVVVAAGNEGTNACRFSPRPPGGTGQLVVGGTQWKPIDPSTLASTQPAHSAAQIAAVPPTLQAAAQTALSTGQVPPGKPGFDELAAWSNAGPCVDISSPGEAIIAADNKCSTCTASWTGTSFSAPMVAGTAASIWSAHPTWSPECVRQAVIGLSTKDVVSLANEAWSGTPNRLAYNPACGLPQEVFNGLPAECQR